MNMVFDDDEKKKALEALKGESDELLASGREKIEKAKRRSIVLDWIFPLTDAEYQALGEHFTKKGRIDLVSKMATIRQVGPAVPERLPGIED
jgi:hypothetical protein